MRFVLEVITETPDEDTDVFAELKLALMDATEVNVLQVHDRT
jgi:hypothetical protein